MIPIILLVISELFGLSLTIYMDIKNSRNKIKYVSPKTNNKYKKKKKTYRFVYITLISYYTIKGIIL